MKFSKPKCDQNGMVIVSILVVTLFLTTLIYSLIVLANVNLTRARGRILLLQSQYAAESGADAAIATLNSGNDTYVGSASEVQVVSNAQYKSTYTVTVASGATSKERVITAVGRLYAPANRATANFTRTIEVVTQRTSTSVVASGVISRNIIEIQSGVKNLVAQSVYLNGYIHMNKNTTNLKAENISAVGNDGTAAKCSIGGTGNLIKPTTFSNPSQTKTSITLGYNNCITPPGNSSNSNFDVSVNQTNLPKVQSTYIPFNQYMDSTYSNSPTGCSEWTSGGSSSSVNIPNTGNTKKTHYPDSGTSVVNSCGSSGDLALGSRTFTIKDHVHIRANLCAASACTPTFNNPDTGAANAKYIFIEGTVNFAGVQSTPGSGPIVLVAYGSDPASKASACPYGGAMYLGSTGTVNAPAVYFLASNGLCLDNTKFSGAPNFGGISGKNIYVSSSPASVFDLTLDSTFPISVVPLDLAWKAVRYRRL